MPSGGRLLFVTEKFPHPLDDGGQIRTWHVLSRLAAQMPVTLVAHSAPTAADAEAIADLGVEVVDCGPRRGSLAAGWFAIEALFTRAPYPMRKNASRRMLHEIRARVESGAVKAVHFNHLDAAQYVEQLGEGRAEVKTVVDTHNLLTRIYERLAASGANPIRRGYTTIQWWRMARFEPQVLRACDQALVCSDLERELAHTWGVKGAMVVPNGVDCARFGSVTRRPRAAGEPPTIVFTGGLSYFPNEDGLRWFFGSILPELRPLLPRFRFLVVGKGASRALLAHGKSGEIEFSGWVDDTRPYLAQADVAIVPLRVGGGTRLKILEAMAAGVPVVSTKIGAEGILAKPGVEILIADEPREFARAIADTCGDPGRARALADAARELVTRRYDWSIATSVLADYYRAL